MRLGLAGFNSPAQRQWWSHVPNSVFISDFGEALAGGDPFSMTSLQELDALCPFFLALLQREETLDKTSPYHEWLNLHSLNLHHMSAWLERHAFDCLIFDSLPNDYWKSLLYAARHLFEFEVICIDSNLFDEQTIVYQGQPAGTTEPGSAISIESGGKPNCFWSNASVAPLKDKGDDAFVLAELDAPAKSARAAQPDCDTDPLLLIERIRLDIPDSSRILVCADNAFASPSREWQTARLESLNAELLDADPADSFVGLADHVYTIGGRLGYLASQQGIPCTTFGAPWYFGQPGIRSMKSDNAFVTPQVTQVVHQAEWSLASLLELLNSPKLAGPANAANLISS